MGLLGIGGIVVIVGGIVVVIAIFAFLFSSGKKSSKSDHKDDTLL
jgi:hypothetical protein